MIFSNLKFKTMTDNPTTNPGNSPVDPNETPEQKFERVKPEMDEIKKQRESENPTTEQSHREDEEIKG